VPAPRSRGTPLVAEERAQPGAVGRHRCLALPLQPPEPPAPGRAEAPSRAAIRSVRERAAAMVAEPRRKRQTLCGETSGVRRERDMGSALSRRGRACGGYRS
jgi:hypothetical protein